MGKHLLEAYNDAIADYPAYLERVRLQAPQQRLIAQEQQRRQQIAQQKSA